MSDPTPSHTAPGPVRFTTPLIVQNPTASSLTLSWGVNALSTGWVEYGPSPQDLSGRAFSAHHGLIDMDERFLSVTITGLKPGSRIHFRAVSVPLAYITSMNVQRGEPVVTAVFSAVTPDPRAPHARVACVNDIHGMDDMLAAVPGAVARAPVDLLVWNGDALNDLDSIEQFAPRIGGLIGGPVPHAPLLFIPGNHEMRGRAARDLQRLLKPRAEESPLGWNYAQRHGPLAILTMDTGEDKPDWRQEWFGLAAFEPYRAQQRDWLASALQRPEIRSAPYLVLFCHIPLNGLPGQNGGDTGGGAEDYAKFSRQCQTLWGPLLQEHRVQLVISGHTHQPRYDAPTDGRAWGQLVGGGPNPRIGTVIRLDADPSRLRATTESLDGCLLSEQQFEPRVP